MACIMRKREEKKCEKNEPNALKKFENCSNKCIKCITEAIKCIKFFVFAIMTRLARPNAHDAGVGSDRLHIITHKIYKKIC